MQISYAGVKTLKALYNKEKSVLMQIPMLQAIGFLPNFKLTLGEMFAWLLE
ncbi:MAG: hypothetical protein HC799_17350 [Limnothrix sp. RL_2_0]|nr:hypothetical protein [Limnothrix sp. RL_2_0]